MTWEEKKISELENEVEIKAREIRRLHQICREYEEELEQLREGVV